MVANKVPGVRAALAYDLSSARNSREHNDANVLTLGAGLIGAGLAEQIVDTWLTTDCTEPRHLNRVAMFADRPRTTPATADVTALRLSETDIERVVDRLHEILGPLASAEPVGPSVGDSPDAAREFVRLGATGLTTVAPAERPGNIPGDLARYIAHKGSITVDGTSLTVNRVDGARFELNIVPHTLQETIMGSYEVGSEVNLEVDLIARYLERLVLGDRAALPGVKTDINEEMLRKAGFIA